MPLSPLTHTIATNTKEISPMNFRSFLAKIGFSRYFVTCGLKSATDKHIWLQKSNMRAGYEFHIFNPLASRV